ncbi:hypothetical protein GCM10010524_36130 [Streptomyces mexicanus]
MRVRRSSAVIDMTVPFLPGMTAREPIIPIIRYGIDLPPGSRPDGGRAPDRTDDRVVNPFPTAETTPLTRAGRPKATAAGEVVRR